jgi:hypothetical protein
MEFLTFWSTSHSRQATLLILIVLQQSWERQERIEECHRGTKSSYPLLYV